MREAAFLLPTGEQPLSLVVVLIQAVSLAYQLPAPPPPTVPEDVVVARHEVRAEVMSGTIPLAAPDPEPHVHEPVAQASTRWDALAACESNGEWDYGPHSGWGSGIYEGGLQFHPSTWDAYKPAGYPGAAYQASREQQIAVAERVLAAQGWGAWPACTRKLGWR